MAEQKGGCLKGLFALVVACSMGQIASAYPTAGGLYHWSSILGGRGWGWTTAWFNLLGLIFVVASVNVGDRKFNVGSPGISRNSRNVRLATTHSTSRRWPIRSVIRRATRADGLLERRRRLQHQLFHRSRSARLGFHRLANLGTVEYD